MKYFIGLIVIVIALAKIPDVTQESFLKQTEIKLEKSEIYDEKNDVSLTFEEIVTKKGYPLTIHQVTTSDGYVLGLFRIPGPKNSKIQNIQKDPSKKVVLLQHGFADSSDSWAAHYEEKSIAFILANLGYDVWMGNNRGNKHSRKHISLNPDSDKQFWNFSYHEMGTKDIPAIIDYITNETGREKISFVGHSQGVTQLLAAMTIDEEYFSKKLNGFVALGPVTNLHNIDSTLFKMIAATSLDETFLKYGLFNELFANKYSVQLLQNFICGYFRLVCEELLKLGADSNPIDDELTRFPVYLAHYPSGTSLKTAHHLADSIRNNRFTQLDANFTPYDLTKLKNVPISLFLGKDDLLGTLKGNQSLREILTSSGSLNFYKEYESMGHMSFYLSKTMEFVKDMIDNLEKYNL